MKIAIDFDGTIVESAYPSIGKERPFAVQTIRQLIADKHKIILWTVREGKYLDEAVQWCTERGIEFYAVNRDYPEEEKEKNSHFSRKLKADVFIDDRNLGGLPDWGAIYEMITNQMSFEQYYSDSLDSAPKQRSSGLFSLFKKPTR